MALTSILYVDLLKMKKIKKYIIIKTLNLKKIIILFFCLLNLINLHGDQASEKRAYIITGPESSGSQFISRVISYVVGKDKRYKSWSGEGFNGQACDDIIVLHKSQPYSSEGKYLSLKDFEYMFKGYKKYFIITTRDKNIIDLSKKRRFCKKDKKQLEMEFFRSRKLLGEIIEKRPCFIWSYETFLYLGQPYLKKLYEFLEVDSDFFPSDVFNGNKKYIISKKPY